MRPGSVRRTWWAAYAAFMVAGLSVLYALTTIRPQLPHEQPMFRVDDDPPAYPQTSDT